MSSCNFKPRCGITNRMRIPSLRRGPGSAPAGARGQRHGSTLVEFALVLPILLMVSMVLVQYGIILNTTISLTNLAREGARYAAVNPTPTSAIENNVISKRPPGLTLTASDIDVTCSTTGCQQGAEIKVTINYNLRRKMFLPTRFFGINIFGSGTYTTSATMRVEG